MRGTLKTMLIKNNYQVIGEADNGELAIQKFKELNPDVVLMDIAMPIMDGISALKEIKKFAPNSKIIIVSALELKEIIMEAISSGADGFIAKPFSKEKIIEALRDI